MTLRSVAAVPIIVLTVSCATVTKPATIHVPVVVKQSNSWIEANGERYVSPALIPVQNDGKDLRLVIASAAHTPQAVILSPSFQWRSLWLGAFGVGVDLSTRSAWQHDDVKLEVDLSEHRWQKQPADFRTQANYHTADRLVLWGQVGVGLGSVVAVAGNMLLFASMCYEECDSRSMRRLERGLMLQGAGAAILIGSGIAWYKGYKRRSKIRNSWVESQR